MSTKSVYLVTESCKLVIVQKYFFCVQPECFFIFLQIQKKFICTTKAMLVKLPIELRCFGIVPISVIRLLRRSTSELLKKTFFESFLILLFERLTRLILPLKGWKISLLKSTPNGQCSRPPWPEDVDVRAVSSCLWFEIWTRLNV